LLSGFVLLVSLEFSMPEPSQRKLSGLAFENAQNAGTAAGFNSSFHYCARQSFPEHLTSSYIRPSGAAIPCKMQR
jgi:hypothetical protein